MFLSQVVAVCHRLNPLVPLALRRLQLDREMACDDLIIRDHVDRYLYASHLLEIARLKDRNAIPRFAMASRQGVSARIHRLAASRSAVEVELQGWPTIVMVAATFVGLSLIGIHVQDVIRHATQSMLQDSVYLNLPKGIHAGFGPAFEASALSDINFSPVASSYLQQELMYESDQLAQVIDSHSESLRLSLRAAASGKHNEIDTQAIDSLIQDLVEQVEPWSDDPSANPPLWLRLSDGLKITGDRRAGQMGAYFGRRMAIRRGLGFKRDADDLVVPIFVVLYRDGPLVTAGLVALKRTDLSDSERSDAVSAVLFGLAPLIVRQIPDDLLFRQLSLLSRDREEGRRVISERAL